MREVHGADIPLDDSHAGELATQNGAGIGVPFNGDDWFVSEDEIGEDAAPGSCE
jgi:hypothetical protein